MSWYITRFIIILVAISWIGVVGIARAFVVYTEGSPIDMSARYLNLHINKKDSKVKISRNVDETRVSQEFVLKNEGTVDLVYRPIVRFNDKECEKKLYFDIQLKGPQRVSDSLTTKKGNKGEDFYELRKGEQEEMIFSLISLQDGYIGDWVNSDAVGDKEHKKKEEKRKGNSSPVYEDKNLPECSMRVFVEACQEVVDDNCQGWFDLKELKFDIKEEK